MIPPTEGRLDTLRPLGQLCEINTHFAKFSRERKPVFLPQKTIKLCTLLFWEIKIFTQARVPFDRLRKITCCSWMFCSKIGLGKPRENKLPLTSLLSSCKLFFA